LDYEKGLLKNFLCFVERVSYILIRIATLNTRPSSGA
jgi:hypothetical protein